MGLLYLVATPIGNLEDITLRALRVLREVDLIATEDTRRTRILLDHYQIHKPLTSLYDHNELRKAPTLIRRLQEGASIALVSEAGTPLISDPGFRLVQLAIAHGITVIPIPGPSAVVAALIAAGLPTDRFVFEGFLPKKPGKRRRRLEALGGESCTLIFYESPRRVHALLGEMQVLWGNRRVAVARELTKKFEEIIRGRITEVQAQLEQRPPLGEVTLVVEGAAAAAQPPASDAPDDPTDPC
ncbi:MAG TPA: 16S rRNA (cytidine(1402)-2'-O)-methyltransferase [Candidatus Tectomicrobia bacterium]|nr:16S rRNA (cytidine(1402)-2'-O)-methyltransferase [Candidatus Tectomicrobia bacterium]